MGDVFCVNHQMNRHLKLETVPAIPVYDDCDVSNPTPCLCEQPDTKIT